MKPKSAQPAISGAKYDQCQTPPYAIAPLLSYLPRFIWEPAAGEGYLVRALESAGHTVIATEYERGEDFFAMTSRLADAIVTNPPYTLKYAWLARCYELGLPFALLLPVETLGAAKAQALFKRHSVEVMLLNRRVNFKMPHKGWKGSNAQFPVAWFCWRLLPSTLMFGELPKVTEVQA